MIHRDEGKSTIGLGPRTNVCAGRKNRREGAHTGDKEAAAREVGHKWSTERDIKGGEKKMIHVKYSRAVKLKKNIQCFENEGDH